MTTEAAATMADPRIVSARVRTQTETHPGMHRLELDLPLDYPEMFPGQYLNLRAGSPLETVFRRPFGVVGFRREAETSVVELYYAVVGRGTEAMARWRPGDAVDCLGPLGTTYAVDPDRPALLVAGGRGAAPLFFLHEQLAADHRPPVRFAFGVRTRELLFGMERLPGENLLVASDDGTVGFHGTVISALAEQRPERLADEPVLYVCGPEALLAAAAAFAADRGLSCQVSLEGVYGCGLGLCRGCAVPLKGEDRYLMQCIEGPVVDAARVDWERMPHA